MQVTPYKHPPRSDSFVLETPFPKPPHPHKKEKRKKRLTFIFFNSCCSMYTQRPMAPINGAMNIGATRRPPASAVSSVAHTQLGNGKDHDFSSLTRGMFTKQ